MEPSVVQYTQIAFYCYRPRVTIEDDMNKKARSLEQRIERVKQKLTALGDLRPGTLSEQYNVCGNPGCRCKADPPQKHGPYSQLSWTRKRKSKTRFIRSSDLTRVQAEIKSYERLQSLVDEWVELTIELSDLKREHAKKK